MDKKIAEVYPIEEPGYEIAPSKERLNELVEEPLLQACFIFYDKNILTGMSSANKKDVNRHAYINILLSKLSEENREILGTIADTMPELVVDSQKIFYPVKKKTTVEEVERYFCNIAYQFRMQDIKYGIHELEDMKKYYELYTLSKCPDNLTNYDLVEMFGFILYDGRVYENVEILRRHLKFVESFQLQNNIKSK